MDKNNAVGSFECRITPGKRFFITEKGSVLTSRKRRGEISAFVRRILSLDEDWSGKKTFASTLRRVSVNVTERGAEVVVYYWHEDGKPHPVNKHDRKSGAYSTYVVEDGLLVHYHPSLMGGCESYIIGPSDEHTMDGEFKDSSVYRAFRSRYDNITLFSHEFGFWEDISLLF